MACNRADCVRGLARLISSAKSNWQNTGPLIKRNARLPSAPSSRTSEPRISAGIRSGVNWTRLSSRPRTLPSVWASNDLPRPGAPTIRTCPPDKIPISVCSTASFCPNIILETILRASASRETHSSRRVASRSRLLSWEKPISSGNFGAFVMAVDCASYVAVQAIAGRRTQMKSVK